ncbi:hypothetical protein QTP70_029762, partial [Hemibagrus guttatus]
SEKAEKAEKFSIMKNLQNEKTRMRRTLFEITDCSEVATPQDEEGADGHSCRTGESHVPQSEDEYIPDGLNLKFFGPLMREPVTKSALREAIERTEVYEYMLFLTSGFGQPDFQMSKFLHACKLSKAGLTSQALDYCNIIATTVFRFPQCPLYNIMGMFIWFCHNLLHHKKRERPEWLMELEQMLQNQSPLSSSSDDEEHEEQFFSCNSEFQESSEPPASPYRMLQPIETVSQSLNQGELDSLYIIEKVLGRGAFGTVYMESVAIKRIFKRQAKFITIPGETRSLPLEVALMEMVSKPPRCEKVVELLEWFETPIHLILVIELPDSCMDLFKFCYHVNGPLSEPVARVVMRQVVQAARHCCERGVIHRDIKPGNLLFNPETLEVKLIDFGCGDLLTDKPFITYAGTLLYCPPEWILHQKYFGVSATVWSLGILLFELLVGDVPFEDHDEIIAGQLPCISDLSQDCKDLITRCLNQDPDMRPSFDEILSHQWLNERHGPDEPHTSPLSCTTLTYFSATLDFLIRSIGNMIGYKKSLSEWQCLSEVKMGRGSPIPPMLRRKIVEQYQKGVSQRKTAKSLKLSSSTVHNIIQSFRESGTISVRKGQGRKTILDARDLRRHCITYRNATVMEITTWAQEYFQKTLSVNTIHRAIRRCRLKLYRSKKKPYLNMIQHRHFLWAKAHLKWTVAKWKTVLWSDKSKFEVLFGKLGRHVIQTKEDKDNPSYLQNEKTRMRRTLFEMTDCSEVATPQDEEGADGHSCRTGESHVPQSEDEYIPDGLNLKFFGPLMSNKMQKDELIRSIQGKSQDCLLHLDELEQQYSYFFWLIMESFCNHNGIRRVAKQQDWCLPLASLLCTNTPEAEHRNAIIEMGNKFASRGWIYAAHICYVVAQLWLDSHRKFQLIGCDREPVTKSALREAIERTEVYEYMLFLTSGFGQPDFQMSKFLHACKLSKAGLTSQALDYCNIIATTVFRFPQCPLYNIRGMFIWFCHTLLHHKKRERPEWLMELEQMLRNQSPLSSSSDDEEHEEQFFSCNSEFQESSEPPASPYRMLQSIETVSQSLNQGEIDSLYIIEKVLGRGGFGTVYSGVRKEDGKKVAIKRIFKREAKFITIPGETRSLPLEVALMEMVSKPPRCENVVELLEWFETPIHLILVIELPDSCMDLFKFCYHVNGPLSEPVARVVMRQVVQAARHCCERGVIHRDIKPGNLLFNPETLEVKLIDFGCGDLLTDKPFITYVGTLFYYPPEWILHQKYFGVSATVWNLGILLFELLVGDVPFEDHDEIIAAQLPCISDLSQDCKDLITRCLNQDPDMRPSFDEILSHQWLNERHGPDEPVRTE